MNKVKEQGKMTDYKEIIHTTKNKLVTLKCQSLADGRRPVYLLGMMEMVVKVGKTEGWILIISGNPLIPHGLGGQFSNRIKIDRLPVTWDQRKAILESAFVPDGYVYLYIGNYFLDTCVESVGTCQEDDFNVLKLLSEYLNQYIVKIDLKRVIPFKEEFVRNIIMRKITQQHSDDRSSSIGKRVKGMKFKFRNTCKQIFVDLDCPVNHSDYKVEIYFLQTFICKPNVVDAFGRGRITRLLEHDKVLIPPTCIQETSGTHQNHCRLSRRKSMEKVTVNLKVLDVPNYEDVWERRLLDEFKVARVDYWTIARLIKIKNDEWNGMTMAMLTERVVEPLEQKTYQVGTWGPSTKTTVIGPDRTLAGPDTIAYNSGSFDKCRKPELSAATQPLSQRSSVNFNPNALHKSSSLNAHPLCDISVKLVLMELELITSDN